MGEYSGKKVAVVGYGLEGEAMYTYFTQAGADVTIVDDSEETFQPIPEGAKTFLGSDIDRELGQFDIISRTPPFNPARIPDGPQVTSLTKEFFRLCPAPIIGVTGTKGKGTTSTLIAQILEEAGKSVYLVGNIGTPAITILDSVKPDDIVVSELSSFQLWDVTQSPQVAVVLMIDEDHQNVHHGMDDYVEAKGNIARFQKEGDIVIVHPANELSIKAASCGPNPPLKFMSDNDTAAHIVDGAIVINSQLVCRVEEVGLIGDHNLENVCAAVTAAWQFTQDIDAVSRAVKNFTGLEHRLELVDNVDGVTYMNDSFSSAPAATMAAVRSFKEPIILIAGGADKGSHFTDLAKTIVASTVKHVLLIGLTGQAIADELRATGFTDFTVIGNRSMSEIVALASQKSEPGDVVLLSPGCASFDMFENFKDRGAQFKAVVTSGSFKQVVADHAEETHD